MSDALLVAVVSIIVAGIGIIPATLAAIWSRNAKTTSNAALHEVKTNGGIHKPNPTLKDYVKSAAESTQVDAGRIERIESLLEEHLEDCREDRKRRAVMDTALAELYLAHRSKQTSDADFNQL